MPGRWSRPRRMPTRSLQTLRLGGMFPHPIPLSLLQCIRSRILFRWSSWDRLTNGGPASDREVRHQLRFWVASRHRRGPYYGFSGFRFCSAGCWPPSLLPESAALCTRNEEGGLELCRPFRDDTSIENLRPVELNADLAAVCLQRSLFPVRPDQHRAKARSRTMRLDRDQVLIVAGADFEFPSIAVRVLTGQLLIGIFAMLSHVNIRAPVVAIAHQHVTEALQFVLIERLDFFWRIVGLVLGCDHLQSKSHCSHVYICGMAVPVVCRTQVRTRVNRNAVVRRLVAGVHLQIGKGSLNI